MRGRSAWTRTAILLAVLASGAMGAHAFAPRGSAGTMEDRFSPLFRSRLEAGIRSMEIPPGRTLVAAGQLWESDSVESPASGLVSVCVGSACALSVCLGSGCIKSVCLGSVCQTSGCFGSACIASGCGGSACIGSGCFGSVCVGSLCFGSVCGSCLTGQETAMEPPEA